MLRSGHLRFISYDRKREREEGKRKEGGGTGLVEKKKDESAIFDAMIGGLSFC